MGMTLDEYLAEVDKWKSAAQAELDRLRAEERKSRLLEVRRKLEKRFSETFREREINPSRSPKTAASILKQASLREK